VVFSRGARIAEGPPGTIREDPVVLDAYLGDDWRPSSTQQRGGPDDVGAATTRGAVN
jgi:hypothetical protein